MRLGMVMMQWKEYTTIHTVSKFMKKAAGIVTYRKGSDMVESDFPQ